MSSFYEPGTPVCLILDLGLREEMIETLITHLVEETQSHTSRHFAHTFTVGGPSSPPKTGLCSVYIHELLTHHTKINSNCKMSLKVLDVRL